MPGLAASYVDARRAFLEAAAHAGARVTSTVHPARGLDGEELAVDVAELGPADGQDVLLVVSGTHGVEGYLGSALQVAHLEGRPWGGGPTVVFVHALNPHGFSWVRRVNEDNVDLNRNFVDWSQPPPANDGYGSLAGALVPSGWSEAEQQRTMLELLAAVEEHGMAHLQQVVSGGQYDHPTGVFYGGRGPTWSNRWLTGFLTSRLAGARRIAVLDLHTGLGPWGHGELISSDAPGSPAHGRQQAWWPDVTSLHDGSSVSARLAGEWLGAAAALLPGAEVTGVAIEYGTVDVLTVLQALRADAVLHAHGDPTGPGAAPIRAQVRAAFLDDDPAWFAACLARYEAVVDAALAGLG